MAQTKVCYYNNYYNRSTSELQFAFHSITKYEQKSDILQLIMAGIQEHQPQRLLCYGEIGKEYIIVTLDDDPENPATVVIPTAQYREFLFLTGTPIPEYVYEPLSDADPFPEYDVPIVHTQLYAQGPERTKRVPIDFRGKSLPLSIRSGVILAWNETTGLIESISAQRAPVHPPDARRTSLGKAREHIDRAEEQPGRTLHGTTIQKGGVSPLSHSVDKDWIVNGATHLNEPIPQRGGWFGIPPDSERTREKTDDAPKTEEHDPADDLPFD